jgi:hypothetical protein
MAVVQYDDWNSDSLHRQQAKIINGHFSIAFGYVLLRTYGRSGLYD